jgi:hypothetical protein
VTDFNSEAQAIKEKLAYLNGQQEVLKMLSASANSNPVEYRDKPKPSHTAKQYALMAMMTGGPVIDDVTPSRNEPIVKMHAGATTNTHSIHTAQEANERTDKCYKLMRLITGAMR